MKTGNGRRRLLLRSPWLDVAIAVAAAVAIGLIGGHELPDYDATFALIWGREIVHGHAPDYALDFRPAAHPLTTFVAMLGAPLGRDGAAELLRWVALLGAGALVAGTFRLGQALFGTAAGVVAALLLFTRAPLWGFAELAFLDPLAAAFVVWAALLEARRPRCGAPVFVLLGLAGLVRPEVWLFAAVYWVWILAGSRARALRLLPLAALGPVVWIAFDLATAQSFLASLSTKGGLPLPNSSGGHGLSRAPDALARYLGGFIRPPELVAAAAGAALLVWRDWRRLALPAAVAVLNVATFTIVAARNGPLEQRYLLAAAAMAMVLAGYALALAARESRLRIAGIVLALACVAYAPVDVGRLVDVRDQVQSSNVVYDELRDAVDADAARCALSGHVHVDDVRLRPFVAYWGAIAPRRVGLEPGGSGAVVALTPLARELSSRSLPSDPDADPGHEPRWRLEGGCARQ